MVDYKNSIICLLSRKKESERGRSLEADPTQHGTGRPGRLPPAPPAAGLQLVTGVWWHFTEPHSGEPGRVAPTQGVLAAGLCVCDVPQGSPSQAFPPVARVQGSGPCLETRVDGWEGKVGGSGGFILLSHVRILDNFIISMV